jgi:hypothetical protein
MNQASALLEYGALDFSAKAIKRFIYSAVCIGESAREIRASGVSSFRLTLLEPDSGHQGSSVVVIRQLYGVQWQAQRDTALGLFR